MGLFAAIENEQKQQCGCNPDHRHLFLLKNPDIPPPDLSRIQPEHRSEYTTLWYRAWDLADYTSGYAPYSERIARMPELNRMVERMRHLEKQAGRLPMKVTIVFGPKPGHC